ncbi:hypothetical protein C6A85_97770, partial [Mycobacterium sp. ITM-2017-0098]
MCKHLPMEPFGDPEARIRDLERPLADQAGASELGTRPYAEAAPTPTVPVPPYAYGQYGTPQYASPYYAAPQRVVRKRSHTAAMWLIPLVVVAFVGAGIAGVVFYANLGSPDSFTTNPAPPISGGGGSLDPPQPPDVPTRIDSTEQVVTVEAGGSISIGGVEQNQTVICNQGAVSVSGVDNTIEIQGSCATVTVSGIENIVTVDSAGTI